MKLDVLAYQQALRQARLAVFNESKHPRDAKGQFRGVAKTIRAFHGTSKGSIVGDFHHRDLYVAPQYVADAYAEGGGRVHKVEFKAKNALVLDTADKVIAAWEASGALKAPHMHGGGSGASDLFADWARAQGFDAVEITPSAFYESETHPGEIDPSVDWTDEVQQKWDQVAGTWGEPQTIILDPKRAKMVAVKKK